jgi:hypothetical protein
MEPPARRVIGRVLSVGFPMPGPLVDNYTVVSAPAFFDYDALVYEMRATSRLVESLLAGEAEARTFADEPVVVAHPRAGERALIDVLARRRHETQRLLEHDGVVVAFLHPVETHTLAEGVALADDWWLPLPDGIALRPPAIGAGEGSMVDVVDFQHPFAPFVLSQAANIAYRAYAEPRKLPGARVFARSRGGAAVAVELPLAHGRLVLLPALRAVPSGDARYAMSDVLQACIRRALGLTAEGRPPPWAAAYTLPGLDDRRRALEDAERAAQAAQEAATAARASYDELARFERLLWQEGRLGLEDVVIEALRRIGFTVYDAGHEELEVRDGDTSALVEVEASEAPVGLAPHYRLRQRIERAIERRPDAPRGVLFVNGERLLEPAHRTHVTRDLRVAAETMRYCIAPTVTLYEAVRAQLAGDGDAVAAYRRALLSTDGLLRPDAA